MADVLNQRGITNENDNIGIDAAFVIVIAIAAPHSDARMHIINLIRDKRIHGIERTTNSQRKNQAARKTSSDTIVDRKKHL